MKLKIGKTRKFGNIEIIDKNNNIMAVVGGRYDTIKEIHDRALLMASASDLLNTLSEIYEFIDMAQYYTPEGKENKEYTEMLSLINKAMFKATPEPEEITDSQSTCCGSMPLVDGKCPFCGDKL